MRKKSYHHTDLKKALFLACHRLLRKTDPDKISLRTLADEIGVSHAAIYRHFKDREALLEVMATYGFERLAKAQKSALMREKTAELGFLKAGVAYILFAIRNPYYYKIMFLTKRSNPSDELKRSRLRSYSILVNACKNYLAEKDRSNDPREYALMAWSLVHGYSNLYLETGFPKSEATALNRTPTQFAEDILRNMMF
jgi:AcrR family transcriptional regulator